MVDAAFDLSAKLGFDTSKLNSSVSNAISIVGKLQQALTQLGASQQTTGLGQVLRFVVAVGEMSKKTFGMEIPLAVGKARMSLNELASALGAVKNQVRGVGTESAKASQTFTAAFKQAATAANQAASATKRAGDSLRDGMAAAGKASTSAGREMVLVGRAADQMSNQVVAASGRAAMAVAQMAMTVQRARQMISGQGGGAMIVPGGGAMVPAAGGAMIVPGSGGAMTQGFSVHATGFTPSPASRGGALVPYGHNVNAAFRVRQAFNRGQWNGNAGAFAQYIQNGMQGRGIGAMSGLAGGLQSAGGMFSAFSGAAGGALGSAGGMIGQGLSAAYNLATQAVKAFESAAQRAMGIAVSGMQNLTKAAGAAALVLGTIAGTSVNISAGFEQSMARVKAVTNSTETEFKSMRDEANRLGIVTQFSARQAADAMGFLGLAGYKANDIIKAMPATLDLAAAGMMDTARSADIMAKIMAGMQLDTSQLGKVTDILAQAFTNANTDLSQLGEAMKYVGPVGHAANKSLEEITATLMVLGNNGYQASLGGTALRNILSHLAQNGKQVEAVMKSLNVKINDTRGYMRPLADIIDDMQAALVKQGREAETTGLVMKAFGERAGPAMAALLAEGGDSIRKYTALLEQSAGTGQRIAEIQRNTFSGHWELLKSTVEQFQIVLGDAIGKDLRKLMDSANEWLQNNADMVNTKLVAAWDGFRSVVLGVADAAMSMYQVAAPIFADLYDKAMGLYQSFMAWFGELPEGTQNALMLVAALTAVGTGLTQIGGMVPLIGPLATALGTLINPLTAIQGAFALLLPLIGAGGSIVTALLILAAAGGPIMLLVAALVGTAGLAAALNMDDESLKSLGDTLKGSLTDAFAAAKEAAAAFTEYLKGDAASAIGHVHNAIGELANAVGLNGLGAQLKAMGDAEIQEAKSAPKLREKRVSKYGSTGARHLEIKDQAEREAIAQSQRLREMEQLKSSNPAAFELAHGESGLQRQRDVVSQANFAKKRATERANEFLNNPDAIARSQVGTGVGDALKGAGAGLSGAVGRAAAAGGAISEQIKDGFSKAASVVINGLQTGKAYGEARENAAAEAFQKELSPKDSAQIAGIKEFAKGLGFNIGGVSSSDKEKAKELAKVQEQARLDFQKNNASDVAQAGEAVAQASEKQRATTNADRLSAAQRSRNYSADRSITSSITNEQNIAEARKQNAARSTRIKGDSASAKKYFSRLKELRGKSMSGTATEAEMAELESLRGSEFQSAPESSVEETNAPLGMAGLLKGNLLYAGASKQDVRQAGNIAFGQQREALAGVRSTFKDNRTTNVKELGQRQQAMQALEQMGLQIMQRIQNVSNLSGEAQQKEIDSIKKLQQEFFTLTDTLRKGTGTAKELASAMGKAAAVTKEATEAEKEKELNAKGQLSPRQQQAQHQQQQAAQQMAAGISAALGMANEQSKAIWQGVFGGAEQVQAMIDQAVATGNTKAATDLIRGRIQAQLAQSQQNLHLLGTSTFTGNFSADNSAYQMTKNTPIANLIRFLESQLSKLPKMASGGIVTGPTQALVGEAGPEAILPLTSFRNMLGSLPRQSHLDPRTVLQAA